MDHDESLLRSADTVVTATLEPSTDLLATGTLPEGIAAVLDSIRPQTRIVSLCTSAFLLAAAAARRCVAAPWREGGQAQLRSVRR